MAEDGIRQQANASEPILRRSPDYKSIYANNTGFAMTAFDLSMVFGEMIGFENGLPVIEQLVKITVSPLHAKIILGVLAKNLTGYEKQFGEIKVPDGENAVVVSDRNPLRP